MLQLGYQPQRVGIVIETADRLGRGVQRLLAGMAERRVTKVMRQRQALGQVFVQRQHPRQAARDLRHFQRMGQPRAVIVALVLHEDLGLVLHAAEGGRVDDPVAVALIAGPRRAFRLLEEPSAAFAGPRRERRALDGRKVDRWNQGALRHDGAFSPFCMPGSVTT